MDEPEDRQEELEESSGLLPALLLTWVVLYLCVVLGMWWYTRLYPADPALALRIHAYALGSLALLFLGGMAGFLGGMAGARAVAAAPAEPEAWLCQHCLKPYVPGAHFCPRCSAPKTFYSGVSNYERAHAQAWILGKAAHHPSRLMHPLLLTASALGAALGLLAWIWMFVEERRGPYGADWGVAAAGFLFQMLWAYLLCALMVLSWRAWRRRTRGEEPIRPEIEYGAPPWFSYDAEWALPELEEDLAGDGGDATREAE